MFECYLRIVANASACLVQFRPRNRGNMVSTDSARLVPLRRPNRGDTVPLGHCFTFEPPLSPPPTIPLAPFQAAEFRRHCESSLIAFVLHRGPPMNIGIAPPGISAYYFCSSLRTMRVSIPNLPPVSLVPVLTGPSTHGDISFFLLIEYFLPLLLHLHLSSK